MAVRVEASRFAVLKVEDDDDSDEKDAKAKHPQAKGNQRPTETKKKPKKKKKTEGEIKADSENSGPKKGSKKSEVSDSQWDDWLQNSNEVIDQDYEKQLNDALLQSKLEYEEKQRIGAAADGNETGSRELKKNKKKNRPDAANAVFAQSSHRKVVSSEDTTSVKSSEAQGDAVGAKDKASRLNRSQELQQKVVTKDYKASILEKEEQIKELREFNRKIEAEVADVKKKNQQFCLMLGRGEMMDLTSIKAELEELQQTRDTLTLEVAHCSSELEKERSKSHALKAERDKLKAIKHGGK